MTNDTDLLARAEELANAEPPGERDLRQQVATYFGVYGNPDDRLLPLLVPPALRRALEALCGDDPSTLNTFCVSAIRAALEERTPE